MTLEQHKGWFHFDPKDPIYAEHFPGHAVVPGSLIIQAFLKTVKQMGFTVTSLARFRFKSFISPGPYPFELEITPGTIRCCLRHEGQTVAEGKVHHDG